MEYSIKKVFIDVFGERELRNALGSDSHNIEGSSDKLHTPLIKFKDKFLIDIFGDIGGPRTPNSINNFFHKNNPKWRGMTDHVQNALVKDTEIFHKFQDLLTKYKNKYPIEYGEIFQNRKEIFSIFHKEDILRKDRHLHERDSFYYDTVNGQFLDKELQNIIEKLSVMDNENAFEYMVFLFILISIFHDTLSSNAKLQYLYNESHIIKYVRNFPLTSTEPLRQERTQQKLLSSPTIFPKTIYGRDALIDDVAQRLKEKHVVFLYGIGGIGKTQIAKKYAEKYRFEYDTIIYGTCNTSKEDLKESVLKELLLSEEVFAFEPKMNRMILSDGSLENDDEYAKRKLQKIKELSNERTLIIVDNFDVMNDKLLSEFINGRYHLLITTRCSYENMHPTIKVKEIEDISDLKQVFFKNYRTVTRDDTHLQELLELVNRHTYTIELIAKHMSNSGQSTLEMIDLLKKEGIICLDEEIRNDDYTTEVAFENLIKMFKIFSLDEEDKKILRYMCLMPLDGVKKNDFKRWAGLKSLSKVNNLVDRSWIIEDTNSIALHPVIRDVIMNQLSPNSKNCRCFLEKIADDLYNAWYTPVEKNLTWTDYALSIANYFSPFIFEPNDDCLFEIWTIIPNFLWQVGKFDDSIRFGTILYETCEKILGQKSMLTGFAAKSLGACYFNSGRLQESIDWYKQGLLSMELSNSGDSEDIAMSYEKVARCYTWEYEQDFDEAERLFHKSIEIRQNMIQQIKNGQISVGKTVESTRLLIDTNKLEERIGEAYFEMGRMFQLKGDYKSALGCVQIFFDEIVEKCPDNQSSLAYAYYDFGVCNYYLGINEQSHGENDEAICFLNSAEDWLKKALTINLKMRGAVALDTISNYEFLGNTYIALGRIDEAHENYHIAISMMEQLFDPNNERILFLKAKIQ